MPVPVTRHYVTVEGRHGRRQVHYRRAGQGPALLLLHQSPQSSRELVPLLAEWGETFTAIAPDTPGYGCSDPLGVPEASLDDFAAATVEFLDAIGVARTGVYGYHTGGMIGVALGHRHPDRITAVACNGLAVLEGEERARILADYLPPILPRWDGGHLAWTWTRNHDQAVFFPWHWQSRTRRMDLDMPSPEHQQQALLELMRAADTYHIAYRGAFTYDGPAALRATQVPTLVTAAPSDPLSAHLARIGPVAPSVTLATLTAAAELMPRLRAHLTGHPGSSVPPPAAASTWIDGDRDLRRAIVPTPVGACHLQWSGPGDGIPWLLVHGPGSSSAGFGAALATLARTAPVLAPDLPGHGESDALVHPALGRVPSAVAALLAVLDGLAVRQVRVQGHGYGALLALALAELAPDRVAGLWLAGRPRLTATDVVALRAAFAPETVDWYGGHLFRYWHTVRDGRLYEPWFRRDRRGIRTGEPDLDPRGLHRDAIELMKSAGHWQELLGELAERAASDPVGRFAARMSGRGVSADTIAVIEVEGAADPVTLARA